MGIRAILSRRPTVMPRGGQIAGTAGWRGLPTAGPAPLQIGVFDGNLLNQFPARWDGAQLHQGVEGLSSHWYTPTQSVVPTFQQTQQPTNVAGGQRWGQTYTGPIGPISAQAMRARVATAQVRQSGLAAMQFAQNLRGQQ